MCTEQQNPNDRTLSTSMSLNEAAVRLFVNEYLTDFGLCDKKRLYLTDRDKFSGNERRCESVNGDGVCVKQTCFQHPCRSFCYRSSCDLHPVPLDTNDSVAVVDLTHFRLFMRSKGCGEEQVQMTSPLYPCLFKLLCERNPGLHWLCCDAEHAGKAARNILFQNHSSIQLFKSRSHDPETWAMTHWPNRSIDPQMGRVSQSFTGFPVLLFFSTGCMMDVDAENLLSCSPNLQMLFLQDGCRRTGRFDSVATISGVDTRVRFRKDFLSGPRVNVIAEETSSLSRFLLKYPGVSETGSLGEVHWLYFAGESDPRPWNGQQELCRVIETDAGIVKKHVTLRNFLEEAVKEKGSMVCQHDILTIGEDKDEYKIIHNVFCVQKYRFSHLRVLELWNTKLNYLPESNELPHLEQFRLHVMHGAVLIPLSLNQIILFAGQRFTHGLYMTYFRYEGPFSVSEEEMRSFNQTFRRSQQVQRLNDRNEKKWVTMDVDYYHHWDSSYDRDVSSVKRIDGLRFQTFSETFPLIPAYIVADSKFLESYYSDSRPDHQEKYAQFRATFPERNGPQLICCHTFRQGTHQQHKHHDNWFHYGEKEKGKHFSFAGYATRQQFLKQVQLEAFAYRQKQGSGPNPITRTSSVTPQRTLPLGSGIKRSPSAMTGGQIAPVQRQLSVGLVGSGGLRLPNSPTRKESQSIIPLKYELNSSPPKSGVQRPTQRRQPPNSHNRGTGSHDS